MNQIKKEVAVEFAQNKLQKSINTPEQKVSITLKKYFIETKGFNNKNLNNKAFSIKKNENNTHFFERLKSHIKNESLNCFLVKNKTKDGHKWIKTRFYIQTDNQIKMEFLNEINEVSKKNKIEKLFDTIQKIEENLDFSCQSKYIKGYLEYHNAFTFDEFVRTNF